MVVAASERLARYQYRVGRPGGLPDRALAKMLTVGRLPVELRSSSVDDLVDLFFSLVDVTHVETFVEAGAKDALASRRASTRHAVPTVVAFEANPYTHRRFVADVVADGVDYRHQALSEASGEIVFLVRLDECGRPRADGQGSLHARSDHRDGYESVEVVVGRLDKSVEGAGSVATALWIDVEGASAQVLRGATSMLRAVEVVMIEVESDRRWNGQEWIDHDVIEFLSSYGLRPVGRDQQSRLQYNVVFARPEDSAVADVLARWRRS